MRREFRNTKHQELHDAVYEIIKDAWISEGPTCYERYESINVDSQGIRFNLFKGKGLYEINFDDYDHYVEYRSRDLRTALTKALQGLRMYLHKGQEKVFNMEASIIEHGE